MNQINKQQEQIEQQEQQIVNGDNVSKLFETVGVIKEKPDIVKFNLKAKGKWIKGGHNSTTINDFLWCMSDIQKKSIIYL